MRNGERRQVVGLVVAWCAVTAVPAGAQDATGPSTETRAVTAEQDQSARPRRVWNEFETRWVSGRGIGALGLDFFRYGQDDVGREQVGDLVDFEKPVVRVVRALAVGTINFERAWTWLVAGVYGGFVGGFDRAEDPAWSLIDLALEIPVPKVGHVLIGKAKEPLSMERLMGGGLMPFMERSMGAEALTASRSVGIRVYNSFADNRLTWAGGIYKTRLFADVLSASRRGSLLGG